MMTTNGTHRRKIHPALRSMLVFMALVLVALGPNASYAQDILSIEYDGKIDATYLDYWIDTNLNTDDLTPKATLDTVDWQTVAHAPINMGFIAEPVWFRLRLHNPSERLRERYLEIDYPLLDDVRIFVYADSTLLDSATFGDSFVFDQRPIEYPTLVKPLQLEGGATVELFIRVTTSSAMQVPLSLMRADTLLHTTSLDPLLNGIYYGALLTMLIYNLFAYINGWERKYLYYALYITSIGTFFACMNGIGFQYLWPDAAGFTKPMVVLSLSCTIVFAALFTRNFLHVAIGRPMLNRFLLVLAAVGSALAACSFVLPYSVIVQPLILLAIVASVSALVSGVLRWRDGHPAAGLFSAAWLVLTFGIIMLVLSKMAWIPRNPVTEYTAQLGSMIEFILLSLALIQQLNLERKASLAAQKSALNFERQANLSRQQALLAQQHAAQELEERVKRRTLELQIVNQKLSEMSTTDPLTGLKNRRFFNERFLAEFIRSKRDGTPLSVIIIDVDHFKSVNDTHGHLLGDELLKLVARQIENEARRASDIITRHGGEEFSAVLIDNTPVQALEMAEKIRHSVADACYTTADVILSCTVSIGVATMVPQKHNSPEELIQSADNALYQSKALGRNRVCVAGDRAA
jgi:diguanylate cyclase (GGDEF)-like protein